MAPESLGKVSALAVRSAKRGPMEVVERVTAEVNGGVEPNHPVKPSRGITFISREQWAEVQEELGAHDLPWHMRRANVLVEGLTMANLIGKTVEVGEAVVEIKDETRPCALMDELHQGLRTTLTPDCRAGVHGQVVKAGRITAGDIIRVR